MTTESFGNTHVPTLFARRARSPMLFCVLVVTCSTLIACKPESTQEQSPANATNVAIETASAAALSAPPQANEKQSTVKAYIDPVTGELREPTAADLANEAKAGTQKASNSAKPPQQIVRADGSVEVLLDQSNDQVFKACVQKDGNVAMGHECDSAAERK
jgi:hypothetical protein